MRALSIAIVLVASVPAPAAVAAPLEAAAAPGKNSGANEDATALLHLAQRYDAGDGGEQDYAKANDLYCKAAKLGNAEAQFRLGWIYANARGVRRDTGVAAALFEMAAQQGHVYAARRLQVMPAQPNTVLPSCLRPTRVELAAREAAAIREWVARSGESRGRREVEALVRKLAPQYAIDPQLVMALITVESGFDPKAVSPKNAQGVMQLIPETAERFGVTRVFDPADNIRGGLAYLRWLMAFFRGRVPLVLAAYNAGEHTVERYKGIPPFEETRNYVERITAIYRKRTHPYSPEVADPSPVAFPRGAGT